MPDWRNAAEYRFPGDFPNHRWAWEFLRRNPDYRKDWATVLQRYRARGPAEYGTEEENVALHGQEPDRWHPDPDHQDFFLPEPEREKWGLSDIFNPETANPAFLRFDLKFGLIYWTREGPEVLEPQGPFDRWAYVDLRLPLGVQLTAARRGLEDAQRRLGIKPHRITHHRDLWPDYVRLLDADLDGRTPKQIADALPEQDDFDERKVWDRLKAARKMREPEGYLSIFLSTPSENSASE